MEKKASIYKSNSYMPIHNAHRKKCHNSGNPNHVAIFCRMNKDMNSIPPKRGVKSSSVRFKL